MDDPKTQIEILNGCELRTTRIFEAPRPMVFKAWTDPAQLAQWWGPAGFSNTFEEFDLRPGGHWRFVMHGPDGTDYPNHSVFVEVVEPERLVLDHVVPPQFRLTARFEDLGGVRTRLVWHMDFKTAKTFDSVKGFAVEGNVQNMERLAAHLAGR